MTKAKPKTKPRGRPSAYKPEYAVQARALCEKGWTDKEMAKFFKVAERTLNTWKDKHPEFLQSLKAGKAFADDQVEQSLFNRALGYSHPEVKVFNNEGKITTYEVTKQYPPDPVSCIFWLKNRRPEQWRDKQEHDHNVHGNLTVENTSVTDDDKAMIRELRKRREDARVTH